MFKYLSLSILAFIKSQLGDFLPFVYVTVNNKLYSIAVFTQQFPNFAFRFILCLIRSCKCNCFLFDTAIFRSFLPKILGDPLGLHPLLHFQKSSKGIKEPFFFLLWFALLFFCLTSDHVFTAPNCFRSGQFKIPL